MVQTTEKCSLDNNAIMESANEGGKNTRPLSIEHNWSGGQDRQAWTAGVVINWGAGSSCFDSFAVAAHSLVPRSPRPRRSREEFEIFAREGRRERECVSLRALWNSPSFPPKWKNVVIFKPTKIIPPLPWMRFSPPPWLPCIVRCIRGSVIFGILSNFLNDFHWFFLPAFRGWNILFSLSLLFFQSIERDFGISYKLNNSHSFFVWLKVYLITSRTATYVQNYH